MSGAAPMVIAGCSRRKAPVSSPVPALELYQGGCLPALRALAARQRWLRERTWIISAEHGLVHASARLLPYDRRMDPGRALALEPEVTRAVRCECQRHGTPAAVLVIAEPCYQAALAGLPAVVGPRAVRWISDPATGWAAAAAVLDHWSQPCR